MPTSEPLMLLDALLRGTVLALLLLLAAVLGRERSPAPVLWPITPAGLSSRSGSHAPAVPTQPKIAGLLEGTSA